MESLEGVSLRGCGDLHSFSNNGSNGFHNLRLLDLTKTSPNIMEFFIQGRDLNNLKWLCLKKCTMQKLPSNLFHCSQVYVLDLSHCLQ
jgi:hypothetical protein